MGRALCCLAPVGGTAELDHGDVVETHGFAGPGLEAAACRESRGLLDLPPRGDWSRQHTGRLAMIPSDLLARPKE